MLFFNLKNQVFSISLCCQDILCPENTKPFVKNYLNLQDVISKCRCCHRHIAARNHRVTNVQLQIKRLNREKDDEFISFILKPSDLKFGMHEVKTLFFFRSLDYVYLTYFYIFQRLDSVLSRSELDPFFIYGIIQFGPKTGLVSICCCSSMEFKMCSDRFFPTAKIHKSSSPEPLGQFHPHLQQTILGCREFNLLQMRTIQYASFEISALL